ncbi:MAG TPA: radical SAM protein [Acidimicrobiales bacterium]|nr:radical SAM protein [Acidimicrobiales bacterium]
MSAGCGGGGGAATAVPVRLTGRRSAMGAAAAAPPWFHLVPGDRPQVLAVARSALFEVTSSLYDELASGDPAAHAELAAAVPPADPSQFGDVGPLPPPRAISLNVAQACNLACTYCYADEGRFHGRSRKMSQAVARRAVDELLAGVVPGERGLVGFIGGEPLLNRPVVHATVAYAAERAARLGVGVGFSITTNGTLVDASDVTLFRSQPFAVTVSVDGGAATHDRHRSRHGGAGSWQATIANLRPLLDDPGLSRVSARATVTRDDLDVARRVADIAAAGFGEIGVSPARTGPDPSVVLRGPDWAKYLDGLVGAAEAELDRLRREGPSWGFQFSNLGNALGEIHRGTCRPLPCGSAYGYLSVDVDGNYATCHRTVGEDRFRMGAIGDLDDAARRAFLEPRLVDRQEPCRSCWARYLCGGGCHAEVDEVGREGCDMIRGWLDYCLSRYPVVRAELPELFPSIQEVAAP